MLEPVLHRDRVARHAQHVLDALPSRGKERLSADPELRDIVTGLEATSTVLRGRSTSPSDQRAHISSHPHVSLVRALLVDCWRRRVHFELPAEPPRPIDLGPGSGVVSYVDQGGRLCEEADHF